MTTDPRIPKLLATWQARLQSGQSVTVEELCGDCPELAKNCKRHVEKLSQSDPRLAETAVDDSAFRAADVAKAVQTAARPPQHRRCARPSRHRRSIRRHSPRRPIRQSAGGGEGRRRIDRPKSRRSSRRNLPLAACRRLHNLPGYEVLGELGRGGMGVVYKARQIGLNRLVAIKMILTGANADPRERARFHSEAESVARLQHPNIVQIYDISQKEGCPWFSLEFVDGDSLYKRVAGRAVDPYEAAVILESLALAIDYAHERGVIHRDLKPANILLSGGDGKSLSTFTPKITDFGLARQLEQDVAADAKRRGGWHSLLHGAGASRESRRRTWAQRRHLWAGRAALRNADRAAAVLRGDAISRRCGKSWRRIRSRHPRSIRPCPRGSTKSV